MDAPRIQYAKDQRWGGQRVRRADTTRGRNANAKSDASVEFMDKSIEAYLAFLSDEPDSTVTRLFDEAERAQEESVTKLAELFANAKD